MKANELEAQSQSDLKDINKYLASPDKKRPKRQRNIMDYFSPNQPFKQPLKEIIHRREGEDYMASPDSGNEEQASQKSPLSGDEVQVPVKSPLSGDEVQLPVKR